MESLRSLGLMLWKKLWVEPFRRHYVRTITELCVVLLCFGVIWDRVRPPPGSLRRRTAALAHGAEPALNESSFWERELVLVYGPAHSYAADIVSAFMPPEGSTTDTPKTTTEVNYGWANEPPFRSWPVDEPNWDDTTTLWQPEPERRKMRTFVVTDPQEVPLECADIRRKLQANGSDASVVCVQFSRPSLGSPLLEYTVHVTTAFKGDYSPGVQFPSSFREPEDDVLVYDELQKIMAVIENQHVELQRRKKFDYDRKKPVVYLRPFPHPDLPDDAANYRASVAYILGIGFLLPFCMRLWNIVHEKETGTSELQKIMGLSTAQYLLGHLLTATALTFLQCTIPLACMLLLRSGGGATRHAYLQGASVTLLLFVFLMFSLMLSIHALFVSCVFWNPSMAVAFGVFYWLILMLAVPLAIIDGIEPSLAHYIFTSKSSKYFSSYTPCLGTYWILKMIGIAVDFDGVANWDLFSVQALHLDTITIAFVVTTMAEGFLYNVFLVWYLYLVLPWNSRAPLPFYFILQVSYWCAFARDEKRPKSKYKRLISHHEEMPRDATVIARAHAVTKKFGDVTALDSVDLYIYNKQVTVVLGHNASGKTTLLNAFAGVLPPTKGTIHVCGYDMARHSWHARHHLSFCQQDDVFFADLTVWEHVAYFGLLKGVPFGIIRARVAEVLDDLNLVSVAGILPGYLRVNTIKRLSVAVAVVSKPNMILLDEPTAGIDAENKAEIWDLLLDLRRTCAVVVTTNDMQEADVLADRLVVLARGRVLCSGSPTFLGRNFGPGYQLAITKSQKSSFDVARTMKIIKDTAPAAEVIMESPDDVLIDLNYVGTLGFETMFAKLEASTEALGIGNITVSATTIEEVFLRVNEDELAYDERDAWSDEGGDVTAASSLVRNCPTVKRTVIALLSKRTRYLTRSLSTLVLLWVVPVAVLWCLLFCEQRLRREGTPGLDGKSVFNMTIDAAWTDEQAPKAFVQWERQDDLQAVVYRAVLEQQGAVVTRFLNAEEQLLKLAQEDFVAFTQLQLVGALFTENDTVEAWYSQYLRGGKAISMSLLHTAVLRHLINAGEEAAIQAVAVISTTDSLIEGTLSGLHRAVTALSFASLSATALRSLFLPLLAGVLAGAYALFPTQERACRSKDLQLMTGMSGRVYWLANLFFDIQTYVICGAELGILAAFYSAYSFTTTMALILSTLVYSVVAIPSAYVVSLFASTQAGAFSGMVLSFSFIGTGLLWTMLSLESARRERADVLTVPELYEHVLALIPAFAFPRCLMKALQLESENQDCTERRSVLLAGRNLLAHVCEREPDYRYLGPGIYHCCRAELSNDTDWEPLSPFGLHSSGILVELLAMLAEGFIFLYLLDLADTGYLFSAPAAPAKAGEGPEKDALDDEVRKERQLVDDVCAEGKFISFAMAVRGLGKTFGSVQAVHGLSLALRSNECLGLLGPNGAGKTTAFEMLAALLAAKCGDAYTYGLCMSRNPRKWQSNLGYCPQSDGVLDRLTGLENLRLMANLRGLPKDTVDLVTISVLRAVGISAEEAHRLAENYSKGDKRKLSLGIAILGLPRILLLDEPLVGVDVMSKQKIFRLFQQLTFKGYSTILLSSHRPDVCQAICDRVGILSAGKLECLGSVPHLLAKFGQGFTLQVKCTTKEASKSKDVEEAVRTLFPGIDLTDVHPGLLRFSMSSMLPWSVLFTRVNKLQREFSLEYVNVSNAGLEDVFMDVVKDAAHRYAAKAAAAASASGP